ncbi:MAG: NAD-dependent epimerase/dehydratase family protein [Planctomycetaceae bacterium]
MLSKSHRATGRPRVLVTGAGGFIGQHLIHHLTAAGMELHGMARRPGDGGVDAWHVGDCGNLGFVAETMARVAPEFVIHLASRTRPGRDLGDFEAQIADTVIPALTVARSLPETVRLGVFFGSCEEYGNGVPPFREDQSPVCFSPYGWAKNAAREGVLLAGRLLGRPVCWVRPFLTFGPGQRPGLLVPDVVRACLEDRTLDLTAGEQTRDLIPVDDVCGMIRRMLDAPERARGQTVNLCSGQPRTIRSVGETIRGIVGRGELRWGALPYRAGEAMTFYGSTETYDRLFGRYPLTDFQLALADTVRATAASSDMPPAASR